MCNVYDSIHGNFSLRRLGRKIQWYLEAWGSSSIIPEPAPLPVPLNPSPPYSTYQLLFISPHATQPYRSKLIFFEPPPPLLLFPFSLWTSSHYQTQLRTRTIFIGSRRFEEPSIGCQHITAKQMKTKQKTSMTGEEKEKKKMVMFGNPNINKKILSLFFLKPYVG